MAARRELDEREVLGLGYLKKVLPLFERLHENGCQRDKAGNRRLHMDQYCALVLLFLYSPMVDSLRAIQRVSELKKVRQRLGCGRVSLGSLSEATRVFDPEPLKQIIGELADRVEPVRDVSRGHVDHLLTAVDGTLCGVLPRIARAAHTGAKTTRDPNASAWRLHTHFDIDRSVPKRIDVTVGRNGGKTDERQVLRDRLQSDHCYVMDRWYAQRSLFNEVHAKGSSYVCRLRDNSRFETHQRRELTDADRAAGVLSDEVVTLGTAEKTDHPTRLVCVRTTPHAKRGTHGKGSTGPASDGVLRLATNLLDPPAEIIAAIYRRRWAIEVFFRFFKHALGCRHLIARDREGIEILAYCAIIACLLLSLTTGRKPTKPTFEMLSWYMVGLANEEELLAHLKKLKRHAE